jgi:hypothetical protein
VLVLANLSRAVALLWIVLRPPTSVAGWAAVGLVVLEQTLFGFATGSRSWAVIPAATAVVAIHYTVRRWRPRELVAMLTVVFVAAPTMLAIRQATTVQPFREALSTGLRTGPSPASVLNDSSAFDALAALVAIVPSELPHQHGRRLVEGIASGALPEAVYAGTKPESMSVTFRRMLFGERFGAGRPYTLPGELWLDFGLVGVLLGGLLVGVAARFLGDAVAGRNGRAAPVTVAGYAGLLVAFWVLLQGTWDLGVAVAVLNLLPLALGVVLLGTVARVTAGARRPPSGASP